MADAKSITENRKVSPTNMKATTCFDAKNATDAGHQMAFQMFRLQYCLRKMSSDMDEPPWSVVQWDAMRLGLGLG